MRNLDPDVGEGDHASRPSRTALVTRPTTLPSYVSSASYVGQLVALDLEHAQRAVDAPAVVLPRDRLLARVAALLEVDRALGRAPPRPEGRARRAPVRSEACPRESAAARARRRRSRPTPASPRRAARTRRRRTRGSRSRRAASRDRRRAPTRAPRARSSTFVASRLRTSAARSVSPSSGSVSRRKSSAPRRKTVIGATIRPLAVSRSASHDSPGPSASTSFESIACR